MKCLITLSILIFNFVFCLKANSFPAKLADIPAFPGAEGFGSYTRHGRGGIIYKVINLNDQGLGSLRYGLENVNQARIIVFEVGGEIKLIKPLVIKNPFVMIAGQTAPSDGIMITGKHLIVSTHDVVIRYLRIRPDGYVRGKKDEIDGIEIWPGWPNNPYHADKIQNIIIDHCSVSWASDENISINGNVSDVTLQWNIISEGLHIIPGTGRGIILSPLADKIAIHHNLIAHNSQRNPLSRGASSFDMRNNIIYNWKFAATQFENGWVPYALNKTRANIISNYYIKGKNSGKTDIRFSSKLPLGSLVHLSDNMVKSEEVKSNQWMLTTTYDNPQHQAPAIYKSMEPQVKVAITTHPVDKVFNTVIDQVGATLPKRDSVDSRIIEETKNSRGSVPFFDIKEKGGYPIFKDSRLKNDSDNDGMPDKWEKSKLLDPHNPADASKDLDKNGYTNIEEYLNSLT
jgi:pectate lyase